MRYKRVYLQLEKQSMSDTNNFNASPEQVIRSVLADLRMRGLSYHDIAATTGYSYQTIANMFSSKKTYFTLKQANRFAVYGYSKEFLMFGEGTLLSITKPHTPFAIWNKFVPDNLKLHYLMIAFETMAYYRGDGVMRKLYTLFSIAWTSEDRVAAEKAFLDAIAILHKITEESGPF